jgi:hypothetical protein
VCEEHANALDETVTAAAIAFAGPTRDWCNCMVTGPDADGQFTVLGFASIPLRFERFELEALVAECQRRLALRAERTGMN